jgi:hypothetical protein
MNLFRYLLSSLIFLTFFAACNRSGKPGTDKLTFPEDKTPELIGRQVIDDLLTRPDFMMYNTVLFVQSIMRKHVLVLEL